MIHQPSFSQTEFAAKNKTTRREKFLARMEELIPWAKLLAVTEPFYPKGQRGRPPIVLEHMLRVYFLQRWYALADEASRRCPLRQPCASRFCPRAAGSDNGSEFLNYHLRDHFALRGKPVGFTRTRPDHKNDNAHIEQKNWMWPRQLLGYGGLERAELVGPINELYQAAWGPLMNFFLPGLKLQRKWREGSQWHKRYEPAQTAYQRLANCPQLPRRQRRELRDRFESLDPFQLKQEVERRLQPILAAEIAPGPSGGSAPQ